MKISIITVCYNSAATLGDTLDSVAAQTHQTVEHIVVDGASTDDTNEIMDRHGSHVTKYISEPDHGIYHAMNKGVTLATGEVIGFLNADDIYADKGVLARVAEAMTRDNLDVLFGDAEFVSSNNTRRIVRRYRSNNFRPDRIGWGWMPAHPTLFLKRQIFERSGSFRTNYRIAGDFELVARIFQDASLRYRYLPEVLVRMRTGGISTGGLRNTLLLNREVLRACRENGIHTNVLKIMSKYPAKLIEFLRK
jgi:glycosyltransferase involved in cell wall biosynthesis